MLTYQTNPNKTSLMTSPNIMLITTERDGYSNP